MAERADKRVPDLLFEEEQEERLADLGVLVDAPERVRASAPLHRLTVFLTYRCNLACPYCKTVDLQPRTFDEARFEALLAQQVGTPVRHLHFTGGEASLVGALPRLVRRAKEAGVAQVSLTSNGTLPAGRYLELVGAGLDELRVSIDAADAALGAVLTGRPHAWSRAMQTLRALGQARRAGAPFFLIANSVVGAANRRTLPELVRALLELGVDDLKLITEVDARDTLGDFPEVEQVRGELDALLARAPAEAWPLLRRKLRTVFAKDAIGLEGVASMLASGGTPRGSFGVSEGGASVRGASAARALEAKAGGAPRGSFGVSEGDALRVRGASEARALEAKAGGAPRGSFGVSEGDALRVRGASEARASEAKAGGAPRGSFGVSEGGALRVGGTLGAEVLARSPAHVAKTASADWRCYVPLTERTVDAEAYYPCSVYLREGGAPLGPLTDSPDEQRRKSARFVREGRCLEDPICLRYCLHCTRTWNERVNRARLGEWLRRWDEAPRVASPGAQLYVTPLGLPHRERFLTALAGLGLRPSSVTRVVPWSRHSTVLQVRGRDERALERAVAFEVLWRERCPADEAEVWHFPREAHPTLVAHKRALREDLDVRCEVPGLPRAVSLHALHLADEMDD